MPAERREFSPKVRVLAFQRAAGKCEGCTARLYPGKYTYDHVLPDWLGGEPTLANCQVLCSACDGVKTYQQDIPRIAKTRRMRAAHTGTKAKSPTPLPGSRSTPWKRKMNGQVEKRT